jgi:succinate dehydrogenase/fumarate reductase flavoprotein subunit
METKVQTVDVLVIGGGTAGPMAAVKAKEANPASRVLLLEKANVKRSGAISMGMDGLNNAVVPGFATPEQYVKEITIANDGIVNQKTVMAYAQNSYAMIQELDSWGVRFEKDETGDYAMRKVHHMGTYVLPMPEGHDIKKVLYRRLKRARVEITNRLVATRLLTAADGSIAGAMAFDCRSRPPGPAVLRLPVRHLREPDQCGRRLQHGLPRRRRTVGHRVLPDQPADQGLQRPRLRLCHRAIRRLYHQ